MVFGKRFEAEGFAVLIAFEIGNHEIHDFLKGNAFVVLFFIGAFSEIAAENKLLVLFELGAFVAFFAFDAGNFAEGLLFFLFFLFLTSKSPTSK